MIRFTVHKRGDRFIAFCDYCNGSGNVGMGHGSWGHECSFCDGEGEHPATHEEIEHQIMLHNSKIDSINRTIQELEGALRR